MCTCVGASDFFWKHPRKIYDMYTEVENAKQCILDGCCCFCFVASTHRCNWKPCLWILLVSLLLLPVFVMKKKLILAQTLWKHLLIYIFIQTLDTVVHFFSIRHLAVSIDLSKCSFDYINNKNNIYLQREVGIVIFPPFTWSLVHIKWIYVWCVCVLFLRLSLMCIKWVSIMVVCLFCSWT